MKTEIIALNSSLVPAVKQFNSRMASAGTPSGFLISEDAAAFEAARLNPPIVRTEQFLAIEEGQVRGGYLLQQFPFWVGGQQSTVVGCQMPISEGIVDKRFTHVGTVMIKKMQSQFPMAFAVGMGRADHPFARLLRAFNWRVVLAPMLFRVNHGARFFREIRTLQTTGLRRLAAQIAAYSGIGAIGLWAAHSIKTKTRTEAGVRAERVTDWSGWADELWEASRDGYSVACIRDSRFLAHSYPITGRYLSFRVSQTGKQVGYFILLQTQMKDDRHFGDLNVGTVLDCFGVAGHEPQIALAATRHLQELGVDLLLTNQMHVRWIQAFRDAGYLDGPSNYVIAMSPELVRTGAPSPDRIETVHFTRGDGDGRINL